ncbi:MAG: response regulator [Candidatus Omnitrophica bacterium]|nr:response regulator [Candidatus Omnitrophota bacterium]
MAIKVLLVDDQKIFRFLASEWITEKFGNNFCFIEASNYSQAVEKFITEQPQLVITDIQMPGENGIELTSFIKNKKHDIPVIIFSSSNNPEYRGTAVRLNAFFSDKGSEEEFIAAFKKCLDIIC